MPKRNQEQQQQQPRKPARKSSKAAKGQGEGSKAHYTVDGFGVIDRKKAEALIYRHTHPDFKGSIDGQKTILVNENGGSVLRKLCDLTDAQIEEALPYSLRRELQRGRSARGRHVH